MSYITHGAAKRNLRLYRMWNGMMQRCYTTTVRSYPLYGGRGIAVCRQWRNDPMAFVLWAEKQPGSETLSIDRINPNGNYTPRNCRFASVTEQARNRRSNLLITREGSTKCLAAWCEELGLDLRVVSARLKRGQTVQEAFQPIPPGSSPVNLTVNGRTMKAEEWAAEVGVSVSTIYQRLQKGQSITAPRGPSGPKPDTVWRVRPGPTPRRRPCSI